MKASAASTTPSQFQIGLGLARYILKATLRNKAGYFFSFVFPLVFVIVFGLFSNARQTVKVGVAPGVDANAPLLRAITATTSSPEAVIELVRGSQADLSRRLRLGQIAAVLEPGPQTPLGVTLVTAGGAGRDKTTVQALVRGLVGELNLQASGVSQPSFQLPERELPGRMLRHIDFILPGQIGFSMLSLATFGIAYNLASLRKSLVLKRMFATSVKPLTFVVAQGLSRSVQAVIQAAIILALGVAAFGFHLAHGWATALLMLVLSFLGILSFIGFGILMSNVAEDEHTLPVVLNLFNLPQVLLAGVFFSTEGLPGWVRAIGDNLPLSYLNTSLRMAALEGAGLLELWPYLLGMFAWAAVTYVLAARTFKPE